MPKKSTGPKGPEQSPPSKGGRPRRRKLTPREQVRQQLHALGKTKWRRGPVYQTFSDCIGLVHEIVKAKGHERAARLREFAEQKKISERTARRLLPEMAAAVCQIDQIGRVTRRFAGTALARFHTVETSSARLENIARTTSENFDLLIARVTAAQKKIENQHRELIFHHPHVWQAATLVTTDPASLDVIIKAWRDALDNVARESILKELEEIARAK